jgi:hypothetical protein
LADGRTSIGVLGRLAGSVLDAVRDFEFEDLRSEGCQLLNALTDLSCIGESEPASEFPIPLPSLGRDWRIVRNPSEAVRRGSEDSGLWEFGGPDEHLP